MIYSKASSFSIVLIFTALCLLGWLAIPHLSLSLENEQKGNKMSIITSWPNTSAQKIERELTRTIEGAVSNINGIQNINSISSQGECTITLEANEHIDIDYLRLNILQELRRLYIDLPVGVSFPQISLSNQSVDQKAVLIYTLRSEKSSEEVEKYANNQIKPKLAFINGLDHIEVFGGNKNQYHISYDFAQMTKLNISIDDVIIAIKNFYNDENIGWIEVNNKETDSSESVFHQVKLSGSESLNLTEIPISRINSRVINLGQIAKIEIQKTEPDEYFRINGQNAIHIVLYALPKSNAISLVKSIEEELEIIKSNLPAGFFLEESYNSTKYIKEELKTITYRTLFTIIILLLFLVLISFNWRYVAVIVLSLITTMSISFIIYYLFGIDIHLYSLAGITVSFGLIIDNSIVMADHLLHRGNLKVYTAILASTITTVASLVVIWFLPEELKLGLWDFAAIILINLLVSLIIALFYLPALMNLLKPYTVRSTYSYYKKRLISKFNKAYFFLLYFLLKYRRWSIALLIWMFGLPLFMLPSEIDKDKWGASLYNATLGNEWYKDHLKTPINKYLGGSLRLFNFYVFENSYYTKAEETKLYVDAAMPKGANIHQLNEVIEKIELLLSPYKNKIKYQTSVRSPQYANISIQFAKNTDPIFPYVLKSKLISNSLNFGGMSWNVYGVGKGFSQSEGLSEMIHFKLSLKGYNLDELDRWAEKIKLKLEEHPRVDKVNTSANKQWWQQDKAIEYVGKLNNEKLSYNQIHLSQLIQEIRLQSNNANQLVSINRLQPFQQLLFSPNLNYQKDDWSLLHMSSTPNKVGDFMTIEKQDEEEAIYKENQSYHKLIDFKYMGSIKFANEYLEDVIKEIKSQLPLGYSIKSLQNFRINKDSNNYIFAILIIIFLMYLICSILFESLTWPFAIILMVPFSFIGIFLIFYYFDFNFDQGGYASFILVGGLVVNASIYLLNDFSSLRKQNKQNSLKNYIKAFNRKIIPILLTILSTVLGLIPFIAFGQNEVFWFALAIGTIGGLIFSLILVFFFFPLFFLKHPYI